jgi:predicted nuclease with TOPRIM domain
MNGMGELKLPWKLEKIFGDKFIGDKDGNVISIQENAEYIVKACNEYKEQQAHILELTTTIENMQYENLQYESCVGKLKAKLWDVTAKNKKLQAENLKLKEENKMLIDDIELADRFNSKEASDKMDSLLNKLDGILETEPLVKERDKYKQQRDEAVEMLQIVIGDIYVIESKLKPPSAEIAFNLDDIILKIEQLISRIKEADNGRDNKED